MHSPHPRGQGKQNGRTARWQLRTMLGHPGNKPPLFAESHRECLSAVTALAQAQAAWQRVLWRPRRPHEEEASQQHLTRRPQTPRKQAADERALASTPRDAGHTPTSEPQPSCRAAGEGFRESMGVLTLDLHPNTAGCSGLTAALNTARPTPGKPRPITVDVTPAGCTHWHGPERGAMPSHIEERPLSMADSCPF